MVWNERLGEKWVKNETTEFRKHDSNQRFQVMVLSSNVVKILTCVIEMNKGIRWLYKEESLRDSHIKKKFLGILRLGSNMEWKSWNNTYLNIIEIFNQLYLFKYHRNIIFIFPPPAKRVGKFIEIRHKKISHTCLLSTLGCLSLCNSVTLRPIN